MTFTPTELQEKTREAIRKVNASAIIEEEIFRDEVSFYLDRRWLVPVVRALKTDVDLHFNMLSCLTAVDHLNQGREPRFDVVYHLYSLNFYHRVRLKVPLSEDSCEVDSICELWTGANYMEREVFDMFGINFKNHPNMERILMPDNWKGHPLRKDFPIGGSKSFYYKHDTNEYAGEPDDLVPRIRVQDRDI